MKPDCVVVDVVAASIPVSLKMVRSTSPAPFADDGGTRAAYCVGRILASTTGSIPNIIPGADMKFVNWVEMFSVSDQTFTKATVVVLAVGHPALYPISCHLAEEMPGTWGGKARALANLAAVALSPSWAYR